MKRFLKPALWLLSILILTNHSQASTGNFELVRFDCAQGNPSSRLAEVNRLIDQGSYRIRMNLQSQNGQFEFSVSENSCKSVQNFSVSSGPDQTKVLNPTQAQCIGQCQPNCIANQLKPFPKKIRIQNMSATTVLTFIDPGPSKTCDHQGSLQLVLRQI